LIPELRSTSSGRCSASIIRDVRGRVLASWVPDVVERIFERPEAVRVVVFGSVGRGDDGPDADIDRLVVLPAVTPQHDDAVCVLRELRDVPVPSMLWSSMRAQLQREAELPGVVRVAVREGQVIERDA
jgi:predicted nucleotidyltransferase